MAELKLKAGAIEWRETDGEVLALDNNAAEFLSINSTGSRLWEALATGTTRAHLVEILVAEFRVSRATAETDVDTFLAGLRGRGLLDP